MIIQCVSFISALSTAVTIGCPKDAAFVCGLKETKKEREKEKRTVHVNSCREVN
jgi:hypothetical protein